MVQSTLDRSSKVVRLNGEDALNLNAWIATGLWILSTLALALWMEFAAERSFAALFHFALLLGILLCLSDPRFRKLIHSFAPPRTMPVFFIVLGLLLYYWSVAWARSQFELDFFLASLRFCLVPILLLFAGRRPGMGQVLWQAGAAITIWIPVEMSWLPKLELAPAFPVTMTSLLLLVFTFYLFLVAFPIEGIGYTLELSLRDWSLAARYFSLFTAFLAIPLAMLLKFAAPSVVIPGFEEWPLRFLAIFFFIALPEEFLFRGIFQNLMEKIWPTNRTRTLTLASLLFGLAHINNANPPYLHLTAGTLDLEIPWVYLILATLAGIFYGLTYRSTGKITAAAVVHTLVDFYWSVFFAGTPS